jgi:hypothetical protein
MAHLTRINSPVATRRVRRKRRRGDSAEEWLAGGASHLLRSGSKETQAAAIQRMPALQREQALQDLGSQRGNQYVQDLVKAVQRQEEEDDAADTDRLERARANWGAMELITVNELPVEVWGASSDERQIIQNTLSLLPAEHIREIPRVVVGERVGPIGTGRIEQGGNSARSGPPELQRIEITRYALENKRRRVGSEELEVCVTLLHETGHWVDWELRILPPRDSEEWEALNAWFETLDYRGATQGPGERAAEAYWRYFAGRLPEDVREIIEASPAFDFLRRELQ